MGLLARPVLRDPGPAAAGRERDSPRRRVPAVLSRRRPRAADHRRAGGGRRCDSPSRLVRDPLAGHDVWLTLDGELQEIAERGLEDALREMRAEGGDVVFLDPATGELLALASRRTGGLAAASPITDPFEPGSTAKLFTAAALLTYNRVDSTATVTGENGEWLMPVNQRGKTRRITDAHKVNGSLT